MFNHCNLKWPHIINLSVFKTIATRCINNVALKVVRALCCALKTVLNIVPCSITCECLKATRDLVQVACFCSHQQFTAPVLFSNQHRHPTVLVYENSTILSNNGVILNCVLEKCFLP